MSKCKKSKVNVVFFKRVFLTTPFPHSVLIYNDSIMLRNTFRCLLRALIFYSVLRLLSSHVVYIEEETKKTFFRSKYWIGNPPAHPTPPTNLSTFSTQNVIFAEKVGFFKCQKQALKDIFWKFRNPTSLLPYLGHIPKKYYQRWR